MKIKKDDLWSLTEDGEEKLLRNMPRAFSIRKDYSPGE